MARKTLPIKQRHTDDCRRRDCDCPWTFRVRLPDGTMPRVTRPTYVDAEQAYHELMARRPEPLADRTTTIAQWAQRWLASGSARGWRPQTVRNYRNHVRLHIVPELGHIPVAELGRDDARAWVSRLHDKGTGPVAIHTAVGVLRTMYRVWLSDGRPLPHGVPIPPAMVKMPPRKEFTPLTVAQVSAIAEAMPPDIRIVVELEAFYGGRVSEVLALREGDVLFIGKDPAEPLQAQLARLAQLPEDRYEARKPQLRFARKLNDDGTTGEIKNARGNRTLPLPQWLAARMADQLADWPPVNGWLFTNRRSGRPATGRPRTSGDREDKPLRLRKPWRYTNYRVWFGRAVAAAGVTLPRFQLTHSLRHHCVSVLRDMGKSDQEIGYWIGDAAQTVSMVYGRPMPDALDRISADLTTARTGHRHLRVAE